jgi:signal transduction histidine kinase
MHSSFGDLLPDFLAKPDIATLAASPETATQVTLRTSRGVPESFSFRFFAQAEGILALGSPLIEEQAHLQTRVRHLNKELSNLTRRLLKANAQLRELNQLKNEFLGMAAHDLRRPVGVIMTYAQFVLDEAHTQLSAEHQGFLRICLSAATGMEQVIDQFLDLAVLESGKLQLDLQPASVADILAGVMPIAQLIATRKQITLNVEVAEQLRRVSVDIPKLQQVLLNLVDNAVAHSSPGQRVWLSTRWEPQCLNLTVRDEGVGLTMEQQTHLFEAFGLGSPPKTASERSTRLGLSIARMVVEAHGGRIRVASQPGQGTMFSFSLPAASSSPIANVLETS